MWGDNRTTPGGKAKNFHYFSRVEVKKDEWIKERDEIVGQSIKGRTLKNKTYRPQQVSVVDFYFAKANNFEMGEFDTIKDIANIAINYELISRAGAYYSFNGNKWQGKDGVLQAIREDLTLQKEIKEAVWSFCGLV